MVALAFAESATGHASNHSSNSASGFGGFCGSLFGVATKMERGGLDCDFSGDFDGGSNPVTPT